MKPLTRNLTAFAILMAFVADILVAPALMAWLKGTGARDERGTPEL